MVKCWYDYYLLPIHLPNYFHQHLYLPSRMVYERACHNISSIYLPYSEIRFIKWIFLYLCISFKIAIMDFPVWKYISCKYISIFYIILFYIYPYESSFCLKCQPFLLHFLIHYQNIPSPRILNYILVLWIDLGRSAHMQIPVVEGGEASLNQKDMANRYITINEFCWRCCLMGNCQFPGGLPSLRTDSCLI